jgi:imidazoleglycerol phosphate synthase glutamine amidotransferase subunit HisH
LERVSLSSGAREIENAEKLILPGVGILMWEAHLREMSYVIYYIAKWKNGRRNIRHLTLVCQLMTRRSEKAKPDWVGLKPKRLVSKASDPSLRFPHMGWNTVNHSST